MLQLALSPALALYLLYRGFRNRAYFSRIKERLGFLPVTFHSTGMGSLWVHAVSVGEVLSAVALIHRVRRARPDVDVFLSTATLAGRETAEKRLAGVARIFYAPLDYRSVVRRVLRRIRPAAVVVMETEIWPNLYRETKRSGASLLIVNGRISDQAWPKYRRWRWAFRHVLALPDAIWAQSAKDAARYVEAGAERVVSAGNLKYDLQPPKEIATDLAAFLDDLRPRAVWVAASTMPPAAAGDPDEDDAVIDAFRKLRGEGMLLVLAPRKPERFDVAAEKLRAAGVPFVRRSHLEPVELPGVLLLDSIGELAAIFERATVVFMGGTLVSRGGHNVLEPAYFGKPILAGPHMENFAEIAQEFDAAGAWMRMRTASELTAAVSELLDHAQDIGARAQALATAKRGVVDRVAARVLEALGDGVPHMGWPMLKPLGCLWALGHRVNLARRQRALATRVVSVGGMSMGGSGKSPVVAHLAARLEGAAILTRGYRRAGSGVVVVPKGGSAETAQTGDEAQMFVRRGVAHVGVGADRYAVGRMLETQLHPRVFLLDDGFQHVQLRRDVDLVLIDATNPWGGGLPPIGRRREPMAGLRRATAVLLTRVPLGAPTAGIEREIRRYTEAPIFRSRMVPQAWTSPVRRVTAFCGIGSPDAFWGTLEELGLEVTHRAAFADHHRYSQAELEVLWRAGGELPMVTTEKDMMNLPTGLTFPIEAVRIEVEIENEAALLRLIEGTA